MASIIGPINQGVIKAKVEFNVKPPISPNKEFERTLVFSKEGGGTRSIKNADKEELQLLPQISEDPPFGIVLKPRQEHYHNFIYSDPDVLLKDPDPKKTVQRHLDDPALFNRMPFFSWKVIHPLYEETLPAPPTPLVPPTSSPGPLPLPLKFGDYPNQNV
jgi:hypothetical protein